MPVKRNDTSGEGAAPWLRPWCEADARWERAAGLLWSCLVPGGSARRRRDKISKPEAAAEALSNVGMNLKVGGGLNRNRNLDLSPDRNGRGKGGGVLYAAVVPHTVVFRGQRVRANR